MSTFLKILLHLFLISITGGAWLLVLLVAFLIRK